MLASSSKNITSIFFLQYTEEINDKFKEEVAKLLNAFCNENELRPQDCGVQQ